MSQSMSPNPPFLSNSLHMPDEEGLYLFLVDTLVVPSGHHGEIQKHEVAHRALTHAVMNNSTFDVIRELVGMSHTLLWLLLDLAFQYEVSIRGKKLGDLQVSGGTPQARSDIEALLRRVEYVENIIDMGWRGLAPIAEFAAIDFSEGVQDDEKKWFLWRKSPFPDLEHKYDKEKDRLVKAVMSRYPTDFGGYHMRFGSFQKALWKAWSEYKKINDDGARKELLRLCMSLLYLENNEVYVMDPIQVILDYASFAQQHGEEARNAFFAER
jgi:hypothetical protein